jgi:hypothetical protein
LALCVIGSLVDRCIGDRSFATDVDGGAQRVIVTMKSVAMKPRRHSTKTLLFQNESNLSSIAIDPCPCGLSAANLRYIGSAPKSVRSTMSRVASGESVPAARAAMPGW